MRVKHFKILFLLAVLLPGKLTFAQEREYLLKAAYIEKIVNFVDWPNLSGDKEFVIAVYKNEVLAKVFAHFFSEEVFIDGMRVSIKSISTLKEIEACHVLFIDTDTKELEKLLENLRGIPVLTISDKPGYANNGVMINFYIDNNKIKFELNPAEFKKASLSVNYMLYKVAKIVKTT